MQGGGGHAGEIACLHQKQFKWTRSMTSERMPWGTLMTSLCFPPPSPFVTTCVHKPLHFRKAEPNGALLSKLRANWPHERGKSKWSKCSVWLAVTFHVSFNLFLYLKMSGCGPFLDTTQYVYLDVRFELNGPAHQFKHFTLHLKWSKLYYLRRVKRQTLAGSRDSDITAP